MILLKKKYLQLISIIRVFGSKFLRLIELANLRVAWAMKNPKNNTYPQSVFPIDLVNVGDYSYGPLNIYSYGNSDEGLEIGKYCSIALDVKFILGGNHRTDCLMTYPIRNIFSGNKINETLTKGKIIIEDDVWIGVGSTILSGIRIGQGCVIAAGAVVTKSFPSFSIIGGNPARIIKKRFNENIINEIEKAGFKIGSIQSKMVIKSSNLFDIAMDEQIVNVIINQIKNK